MALRILSRKATLRAFDLAKSNYRPPQILQLQEEIERKTKVAELRASVTGVVDMELVQEIVAMKLELNALYGDWAQGKIQ